MYIHSEQTSWTTTQRKQAAPMNTPLLEKVLCKNFQLCSINPGLDTVSVYTKSSTNLPGDLSNTQFEAAF